MAMDGTYFVGKTELLNWINSTLDLNLSKVEQTSSGAVACQLLDAMSPGSVAMSKVNFNAVNDYDTINNYKVLQAGFNKLNIDKHIDVQKLIKARPLDNIEFMQWFKRYFDDHTGGGDLGDYDPVQRRAASKTGDVKGSRPLSKRPSNLSTQMGGSTPSSIKGAGAGGGSAAPLAARRTVSGASSQPRLPSRSSTFNSESETNELAEQLTEMKLKVDGVERERDFYYDKLRDIEILCQMSELQNMPVVKYFERILYAADEAESKQIMVEAQQSYSCANGGFR